MKTSKRQLIVGLVLGALILVGNVQAEEKEPPVSDVLDPMIVTATRDEKRDLDIAAATQVFTHQAIIEMGAQTVLEVIENIPDFVVSQSPSGNGLPGFRGITGYLTIMINGIPLANEGYFQLGSIATSGVERVEVVKGGSAVLYGSDATTGVVNIITKKDDANHVSVGAGNNGQLQGGAFVKKSGFSVAVDHYRKENYGAIYKSSSTEYRGEELERTNVNLNYELNEHINLMYLHSQKESESSKYRPDTDIVIGDPWENEQVYDIGQASLTWDDLRVLLYGQSRKWEYVNPSGKQRGRYYGVDIQDKWRFSRLAVTAGGNYDHEKSSRVSGGEWIDNTRDKGAVFVLTETDLFSATKLMVGAREVFSDTSDYVFCPQLQILQGFGETSSIYLNVNKSLREPNLSQIYGYSATQVPNEDLDAEIGWTYEIGWKKQITKADILKLAIYHMEIDDRIYSSKTTSGETIYLNASKFKNTGAELSYEHKAPEGLFYGAGLAYMDPKQKAAGSDEWEDTEHQLGMHLNIGYRWLDRGMCSLMVNHNAMRSEDTDPMWDVSLNASYDLSAKDTLRLHINNLLDRDDYISSGGGSLLEERNLLLTYERSF